MTINAKELAKHRPTPLKLPRRWRELLGKVPENIQWKYAISGPPANGKSTMAFQLSDALARKGKVLYGNFEENTAVGTLSEKLRENRVRNESIDFLETRTLDKFLEELNTGKYDFAVIDSLSVLFDSKATIKEFFGQLEQDYPSIPIIIVIHYTKGGQYYGSAFLDHIVDIHHVVKDGKARTSKNRFTKRTPKDFKIFR